MKFIHIADTHIGCEIPVQYREIRKKDFIESFKQIIDFAIKEKVNFIIHSGDFLDDYFRISSKILIEIIDLLLELNKNDIPLFIIKGNHDNKGQKQNTIEILKKLGLIEELDIREPKIIKDFCLYGLSEPANIGGEELRAYYEKKLKEIRIDKSYFTILLFHGISTAIPLNILKGYLKDPRIISHDIFPKVDFYGFGHFHNSYIKYEDVILSLPGSTERTEISEYEEKSEKGFFYFKDGNYEFIKLNTRKISIIEQNIEKEEDFSNLLNKIYIKSKDTLIKLKIRYSRDLYDLIRKGIDNLISSGYMIIDELFPIEYEEYITEENVMFEDILERNLMVSLNKEEVLNIFNKIKYLFEEYYNERSQEASINRIRDALFRELI